jgi:hypothetical protein
MLGAFGREGDGVNAERPAGRDSPAMREVGGAASIGLASVAGSNPSRPHVRARGAVATRGAR